MDPFDHFLSPRFSFVIVLPSHNEKAHPFGNQDEKHAAEEPEDGEEFWEILKRKMIVKDMGMEPEGIKDQTQAKADEIDDPKKFLRVMS